MKLYFLQLEIENQFASVPIRHPISLLSCRVSYKIANRLPFWYMNDKNRSFHAIFHLFFGMWLEYLCRLTTLKQCIWVQRPHFNVQFSTNLKFCSHACERHKALTNARIYIANWKTDFSFPINDLEFFFSRTEDCVSVDGIKYAAFRSNLSNKNCTKNAKESFENTHKRYATQYQ